MRLQAKFQKNIKGAESQWIKKTTGKDVDNTAERNNQNILVKEGRLKEVYRPGRSI